MQTLSEQANQTGESSSQAEQELHNSTSKSETQESALESPLRKEGESQTAYLERASRLIVDFLKSRRGIACDPYRLRETELAPAELAFIEELVHQARRQEMGTSRITDQESALIALCMSIGTHSFHELTDSTQLQTETAFDKTTRNRKLFQLQPAAGPAKRESYCSTLFLPVNTEATRALVKELVQDKTVVVLGGGHARLLEEMHQNDITPRAVINVEPFVKDPVPDADPVLPNSADDPDLIQALHQLGIESADEIWAEYSVPAYLIDPKAIQQLFINIDSLLADGGTARIWPTVVAGGGTEADVAARKSMLTESVSALISTGRYELVPYQAAGLPGFSLHKIAM